MRTFPPALTYAVILAAVIAASGCGILRPAPTPLLPPDELYSQGEAFLEKKQYLEARESFRKIVERHPNSTYAPRARSV